MTTKTSKIQWPSGPRYPEWVAASDSTIRAWVLYKLCSAEWYIDTLETVGDELGFDRYVGVEMALDGALAALTGAFDALVGGLTYAAEEYQNQQLMDRGQAPLKRTEPHTYKWPTCRAILNKLDPPLRNLDVGAVITDINTALGGKDAWGWLTELTRARNAAIHQNTLSRHVDVHVGKEVTNWRINIGSPGRAEHPVHYLRGVHSQLRTLTTAALEVIDHLTPNGMATSKGEQSLTNYPDAIAASAHIPTPTVTTISTEHLPSQ